MEGYGGERLERQTSPLLRFEWLADSVCSGEREEIQSYLPQQELSRKKHKKKQQLASETGRRFEQSHHLKKKKKIFS